MHRQKCRGIINLSTEATEGSMHANAARCVLRKQTLSMHRSLPSARCGTVVKSCLVFQIHSRPAKNGMKTCWERNKKGEIVFDSFSRMQEKQQKPHG
jgi:hypothetical protein